ncbi:DUF3304 domain-containing protein [Chromobacterium haemolyticum]|uniref:DUF3304 domain-containing protein n=1 Tax=Chromobacterium haemolyticum TaxID=394935 RepID=UPI001746E053|nr:DUF3304 domain-containing protein [Chromobacterium haemolyticum]QOD81341.1 DUF3304 domain-containing protein [Chromobacterium haemolyticum]
MFDFAILWRFTQRSLTLLALAVLPWLPASAMGRNPANEMLPAPVSGYNHTSANINNFSVNRAGGHNISPFNNGGGSQSCCASLPRQWRPGLMATVEWEKDPNPRAPIALDRTGRQYDMEAYERHAANYTQHRATLEIPRYEKSCGVQVHFLPCDEVRVVSTCRSPLHPDYPYKAFYQTKEPKTCPK